MNIKKISIITIVAICIASAVLFAVQKSMKIVDIKERNVSTTASLTTLEQNAFSLLSGEVKGDSKTFIQSALKASVSGETISFNGCIALPKILKLPVHSRAFSVENKGGSDITLRFSGETVTVSPGKRAPFSVARSGEQVKITPILCGNKEVAAYVMVPSLRIN